ncbi:hypothetical protein AAFF_G00421490 [Aldrovandia affinis]|uniref:Uncharacterized protein n=1 Tax=Aldrovandia affinis TaxID=143900 RepID=A0AAD7WIV0_9TELE|nr:hypothetical protein AAFF_G00421490 [Aldrovandia affinis]
MQAEREGEACRPGLRCTCQPLRPQVESSRAGGAGREHRLMHGAHSPALIPLPRGLVLLRARLSGPLAGAGARAGRGLEPRDFCLRVWSPVDFCAVTGRGPGVMMLLVLGGDGALSSDCFRRTACGRSLGSRGGLRRSERLVRQAGTEHLNRDPGGGGGGKRS